MRISSFQVGNATPLLDMLLRCLPRKGERRIFAASGCSAFLNSFDLKELFASHWRFKKKWEHEKDERKLKMNTTV